MLSQNAELFLLQIRYPIKPIWGRLIQILNLLAFSLGAVFFVGLVTGLISGPSLKFIAQLTAPLLLLAVAARLLAEKRQSKDRIALADNAVVFQNEQLGVAVNEIDYLQIRAKGYRGMKSGKLLKYSGWENQLDLMLTDGRRCEAELLIQSREDAELLAKLEQQLGFLEIKRA